MLKKLKDKLYYYFAEKNWGVRREYGPYVDAHQEEHKKHRIKHWWILVRLNWHYRVLRRNSYLIHLPSNNHPKRKLPYMDGPESECAKRQPLHFLARDLMQYDLISFDIFDTLIFRPFKQPQDLFQIVASRLDFQGFNESFYILRRRAEVEARDEVQRARGHREVNIFDIYEQLAKLTSIDVEEGVETEFQTELDYCYANPYMLEVFRILRAQGKRIVITSDMYFPQKFMEKLLEKNGFTGYEKLYISCDYRASKARGTLYSFVKKDYPDIDAKKIVHVGDNHNSDSVQAEKCGLKSSFYRNVNEIGNQFRPENMTGLVGSFYSGMVNARLHNGLQTYSFFYEYGYTYMGLYVLGMVNWLHRKAKSEGINKIVFLSRDGSMYSRVFNMFYKDVDNCYCYWSRNAAMKYVVAYQNFSEFLARYVDYRISDSDGDEVGQSVRSLLDVLELPKLFTQLPEYGLTEDMVLSKGNQDAIKRMLLDNRSYILETYRHGREKMIGMYRDAVGQSEHIALIDVGWTGHTLLNLKRLVEHAFDHTVEVTCWMAAEKSGRNAAALLERQLDAYLFSTHSNRDIIWNYHNRKNSKINTPLFEFATQTCTPSFMGVYGNGQMRFDIPIVEDYKAISEIERGIIDFCREYWFRSAHDPILRNISGVDAYAPCSMALASFDFIRKNFSNVHNAFGIGSNTDKQRVESFGEQFSVYQKKGANV